MGKPTEKSKLTNIITRDTMRVHERTYEILANSSYPTDRVNIPDDHKVYDADPSMGVMLQTYKTAYKLPNEADNALKVVKSSDKTSIYTPSIVAQNGSLVVEWGGKYYPLPENARFDAVNQSVYVVDVNENELPLRVRVRKIEVATAATKEEKALATADKDNRTSILQKMWDGGKLHLVTSEAFDEVYKLGDIGAGTYQIVGYKMGGFNKYIVKLEDGRWVRTNTAINEKLAEYDDLGVEVSIAKPATLVIGVSVKNTSQGHPIYPTKLTCFDNADLPVFDF